MPVIEGVGPQSIGLAGVPSSGTDEVQTLTVTATGGTFRVAYDGYWTADLAEDISAANLQVALRALLSINGANVTATGDAGGPFTITFIAGLGKLNVPAIVTDGALLTGGAATAVIVVTTPGVTASGRGRPTGTRLTDTVNGVDYVNTGTALAPVWAATSVGGISQELIDLGAAIPAAAVANVAGAGIAIAAADAVAVAGLTPAGGAGAAEGAYDTAANRNTFIATVAEIKVTVNALVTEATELKADITTLSATVVEIKTQLNALLAQLRTPNAAVLTP